MDVSADGGRREAEAGRCVNVAVFVANSVLCDLAFYTIENRRLVPSPIGKVAGRDKNGTERKLSTLHAGTQD
jgi:hypothetical protein